jgi:Lysophospholipase
MNKKPVMTLLLTYLLMLLAVFLLQRKMMYFPARMTPSRHAEMLTQLNLQPWPAAADLRGLISKVPPLDEKGTILVFHGNAGSAVHRTYFLDALQMQGYRVVIAEYPGYGTRSGSPTEATLIQDGIATAKMAAEAFKGPLFLCGESLGSGVVAGIAASKQVPVKGLLLITPFDSMSEVAQHHYWFFLARWLILDKYDTAAKLRDFHGPIALIMAEQDEVIPNNRTLALFDGLPATKKLWRFENAGHNSLPMDQGQPWWQQVMQFIDH